MFCLYHFIYPLLFIHSFINVIQFIHCYSLIFINVIHLFKHRGHHQKHILNNGNLLGHSIKDSHNLSQISRVLLQGRLDSVAVDLAVKRRKGHQREFQAIWIHGHSKCDGEFHFCVEIEEGQLEGQFGLL